MADAAAALSQLVSPPGPGKPAHVDAINRAATVLISAHLGGYIEDLFDESVKKVIGARAAQLDKLIRTGKRAFYNPRPDQIERLFGLIGIDNVLSRIRWQKANNDSIRRRLNRFVDLRNDIAHGRQARVTKAEASQLHKFAGRLAERLDARVGSEIESITGAKPW